MASRIGYSTGIDLREIADLVMGFERQNSVKINLRAYLVSTTAGTDLEWIAEAKENILERPAQGVLAYAKIRCGATRLATVEALLIHLLYQLDFQLAELELTGKRPPKA